MGGSILSLLLNFYVSPPSAIAEVLKRRNADDREAVVGQRAAAASIVAAATSIVAAASWDKVEEGARSLVEAYRSASGGG